MLAIRATFFSRTRFAMIQKETRLMRMMKIPRLMRRLLKRTHFLGLHLRVGFTLLLFDYCLWLHN